MSKTWLVLDSNFLCHRAFYSTGHLKDDYGPTGVLYGFFRDIINFQEKFNTNNIVFCFDSSAKSVREELYPSYKESRKSKELEPELAEALSELGQQIVLLRKYYLPELGFKNIFWQKGYEADDMIASVVKYSIPQTDEAVIVSNDHDMYQLLEGTRIQIYDPRQKMMMRQEMFEMQYGVSPNQWVDVKAYAGCNSDEVEGIPGVGEVTACKFIRGVLKPESKAFQNILYGKDIYHRNLPLVKLPFKGTNIFQLLPDEVNKHSWSNMMEKLGMKSLIEFNGLVKPYIEE